MKREQKEQVVDELTARLKAADTLLVADYRGLTMPQIDELRSLQPRGQLLDNLFFLFSVHLTSTGLLSSQGGPPVVFGGSVARREL